MNIVQCLSHSIEAHDQLKLYTELGYNAFDIGGYIDPRHPHDPKRPLVDAPFFPDLKAAVDAIGSPDNLGAAQEYVPDAVLDWADVLIYHHHLYRLFGQWSHIREWLDGGSHRRVIWRSVGQSVTDNELDAAPFMADGLERVLYSPKERNIPGFSGGDSPIIRFYKDPAEWSGWTGEEAVVLNISQHDERPHARDEWLNWGFWEQATEGLPRVFGGVHSERTGGLGTLSLEEMQGWLRRARVYLYTGTQPASYTLGLIEAMMTGIPVVSIAPRFMRIFPYGPDMFEGHEIVGWYGDPPDGHERSDAQIIANTASLLRTALGDPSSDPVRRHSEQMRARALALFGRDKIAAKWLAYLGQPASVAFQREAVTA